MQLKWKQVLKGFGVNGTSLALLSLLFYSCHPGKPYNIEGSWTGGNFIFEAHHDTLRIDPYGNTYLFEIRDTSIYLLKRLDVPPRYRQDTMQYPHFFGSLKIGLDTVTFIQSNFDFYGEWAFYKLFPKKFNGLQRIQFSSGYTHEGFDFEVDTAGTFYFTRSDIYGIGPTFSGKLNKRATTRIFEYAAFIDFNALKDRYVDLNCADGCLYGFVFFYSDTIRRTFIHNSYTIESLLPLQYCLEGTTFQINRFARGCLKLAKNKCYQSRLLEAVNLMDSIRYLSVFDTVNYKLPIYNRDVLCPLMDKYYHFKEEHICYYIKFDSSGCITKFDFSGEHSVVPSFLNEVKRIKAYQPAVFQGKKKAIEDFDCLSCPHDSKK